MLADAFAVSSACELHGRLQKSEWCIWVAVPGAFALVGNRGAVAKGASTAGSLRSCSAALYLRNFLVAAFRIASSERIGIGVLGILRDLL